jgi:hypothetical protein
MAQTPDACVEGFSRLAAPVSYYPLGCWQLRVNVLHGRHVPVDADSVQKVCSFTKVFEQPPILITHNDTITALNCLLLLYYQLSSCLFKT